MTSRRKKEIHKRQQRASSAREEVAVTETDLLAPEDSRQRNPDHALRVEGRETVAPVDHDAPSVEALASQAFPSDAPLQQPAPTKLDAAAQSAAALAATSTRLFFGWFEFGRERRERSFEALKATLECRTPQELAAVQFGWLRENVESILAFGQRRS